MHSKKRMMMGYLFIMPYFVIFFLFSLYPILYSLFLSFTKWDGLGATIWIGIDNYKRLLTSGFFYQSVWNTLTIWIFATVPQLTLAFFISLILNTKWIRGRAAFRSIFYFPNLVTPVTVGVTFSIIFGTGGAVNNLLMSIGAIDKAIMWANDPWLAKVIIGIMICWQYFGYNAIFLGAGLSAIPQDYYEAAEVDGANSWEITTKITVPLMKPILTYILITSIIGGLQIFDVTYMFKDVGNSDYFKTMIYYMYENGFKFSQFGFSAAAAYVIFVIIAVFSLISYRLTNGKKEA